MKSYFYIDRDVDFNKTLKKEETFVNEEQKTRSETIAAQYILTLSLLRGIGRQTIRSLIPKISTCTNNPEDFFGQARKSPCFERKKVEQEDFISAFNRAGNIMKNANKNEIIVLTILDSRFPEQLKTIPDSPVFLFAKGNVDIIKHKKMMAVIGTRKPSNYAKNATVSIVKDLVNHNFVIVSGLALGCDAQAHQACLSEQGKTIAILANGLDMVYPKRNTKLANDIIKNGGCLLSEYMPSEGIKRHRFIERNRLQSGLSAGVILIESGETGGSMYTATFCKKQKRRLAVLSHNKVQNVNKSQYEGNTILHKGDAFLISTPRDLKSFIAKCRLLNQKTLSNFFTHKPREEKDRLTVQQRERIKANRLEALRRRSAKKRKKITQVDLTKSDDYLQNKKMKKASFQ